VRPYLKKYPTLSRVGGVAQVVEPLLSKCGALEFESQYQKKKKKMKPLKTFFWQHWV
jgi:hypothetical protein